MRFGVFAVTLDIGVTTNPDRARRARMGYIELGAIWSPSDDLELALGLLEQVGDGEPSSRTVIAGLTWRFLAASRSEAESASFHPSGRRIL